MVLQGSSTVYMGARGHRQEWELALPWKMYTSITTTCQLQHFGSHTKRTKIVPKHTFHRLKIATAARALLRTPLGEPTAPPGILAGFKGSAWQQRRNGRVDRARKKGKGREGRRRMERQEKGWRGKRGRKLSPSCKNSCRRPWLCTV